MLSRANAQIPLTITKLANIAHSHSYVPVHAHICKQAPVVGI